MVAPTPPPVFGKDPAMYPKRGPKPAGGTNAERAKALAALLASKRALKAARALSEKPEAAK